MIGILIIVGFILVMSSFIWFFSQNKVINFLFPKPKATPKDVGQKVAVLWNPQGARDFGEKEIWREGVIDEVSKDGSFWIQLDGATMFCLANKYGRDIDPFKNIKYL